jgi:hypothetical protein
VLSIIISIDYEERGVRILQVRVNVACYYMIPKDWNTDSYICPAICQLAHEII